MMSSSNLQIPRELKENLKEFEASFGKIKRLSNELKLRSEIANFSDDTGKLLQVTSVIAREQKLLLHETYLQLAVNQDLGRLVWESSGNSGMESLNLKGYQSFSKVGKLLTAVDEEVTTLKHCVAAATYTFEEVDKLLNDIDKSHSAIIDNLESMQVDVDDIDEMVSFLQSRATNVNPKGVARFNPWLFVNRKLCEHRPNYSFKSFEKYLDDEQFCQSFSKVKIDPDRQEATREKLVQEWSSPVKKRTRQVQIHDPAVGDWRHVESFIKTTDRSAGNANIPEPAQRSVNESHGESYTSVLGDVKQVIEKFSVVVKKPIKEAPKEALTVSTLKPKVKTAVLPPAAADSPTTSSASLNTKDPSPKAFSRAGMSRSGSMVSSDEDSMSRSRRAIKLEREEAGQQRGNGDDSTGRASRKNSRSEDSDFQPPQLTAKADLDSATPVTAEDLRSKIKGLSRQQIEEKVNEIYRQFRPTKLDEVPQLMQKYVNREGELLLKVQLKYLYPHLDANSGAATTAAPPPSSPQRKESNPFGTAAAPSLFGNTPAAASTPPQSTGGNSLFGSGTNSTSTPFAKPSPIAIGGGSSTTAGSGSHSDELGPVVKRVQEIYAQCNPSKLSEIPALFEKYRGKELQLVANLEKKYNVPHVPIATAGVSPASPLSQPAASLFGNAPSLFGNASSQQPGLKASPTSSNLLSAANAPSLTGSSPFQSSSKSVSSSLFGGKPNQVQQSPFGNSTAQQGGFSGGGAESGGLLGKSSPQQSHFAAPSLAPGTGSLFGQGAQQATPSMFGTPAPTPSPFGQQQMQPSGFQAASSQQEVDPRIVQHVQNIYSHYNQSKLSEIPALFEKYRGKELQLVANLEKKYNVPPAHCFSAQQGSAAGGIFANPANQMAPGSAMFGNSTAVQASPFAQQQAPPTSLFGGGASSMNSSPFGQASAAAPSASPFAQRPQQGSLFGSPSGLATQSGPLSGNAFANPFGSGARPQQGATPFSGGGGGSLFGGGGFAR